jgi:uncharacterized protein (TIGR02453 family)
MKQVFDFLKQLEKNNDRDWFHSNKKEYQVAKTQFDDLVRNLISEIGQFDAGVRDLEPKQCVFRIHRDVRFSKNKLPYKTHFGASMAPGGKSSSNPTYYIHAEPGKSMIAAGVYMPPGDEIKKIRQEIDYNADELKKILNDPKFQSTFGGLQGESLKTAPKGYPKDHPEIELLRFKSYIVWTNVKDSALKKADVVEQIGSMFRIAQPFNQFLSVAMSD